MALTCPFCTSKDVWQPFREGWKDRLLSHFGYARAECRGCRRMILIKQQVLAAHKQATAHRVRGDSVRFVLAQPPEPPVGRIEEAPAPENRPLNSGDATG